VLYSLIALAVVAGAVAVGSILVTALLVVPAATARLLARRVLTQMALASAFGTLAGWLGLYVSYYQPVASGGAIVLASVVIFLLALTLSPRDGLPARWLKRRPAIATTAT
jgi:ABC-type Mn2+/Zn2+ transport system permease subunit